MMADNARAPAGMTAAEQHTAATEPRSRREPTDSNEAQVSPLFRMVYTLVMLLEAKDPFMEDHSSKVAQMSAEIGRHMGMTQEALCELQLGALLHDIGNLGVRDDLLQRRSRLKDDEKTAVSKHTEIGAMLMEELFQGTAVLDVIKYHHERWDGAGRYGLTGENIPLGARIVAVADSFDAMSSDRPYRLAMAPEQYMFEFKKHAGRQFDPSVVRALLELLEGKTTDMDVATTSDEALVG